MVRLCRLTSSLSPRASRLSAPPDDAAAGDASSPCSLPRPPTSRSQRVSTAPLEHGPRPATSHEQPQPGAHGGGRAPLRRWRAARSLDDKLRALDVEPRVADFFGEASSGGVLGALEPREVFLLKCLVAAGQEHVLGAELYWDIGGHKHHCNGAGGGSALREALYSLAGLVGKWSSEGVVEDEAGNGEMELLRRLLKFLSDIEEFYNCIGGIIG